MSHHHHSLRSELYVILCIVLVLLWWLGWAVKGWDKAHDGDGTGDGAKVGGVVWYSGGEGEGDAVVVTP